jgi:hypothetical protein
MKHLSVLLFIFCLLVSNTLFSQPCPPGPDGEPCCTGTCDPGVPLDDYIPVALIGGAIVGSLGLRKKRKNLKTT